MLDVTLDTVSVLMANLNFFKFTIKLVANIKFDICIQLWSGAPLGFLGPPGQRIYSGPHDGFVPLIRNRDCGPGVGDWGEVSPSVQIAFHVPLCK